MHFLLIVLLSSSVSLLPMIDVDEHKFYVSKCMIEYNQSEKALQVSLHVFVDDLENALEERGATNLLIGTPDENEGADEHILSYFKEKFTIHANGLEVPFDFIGKELSDDYSGLWCYLEIPEIDFLSNLKITSAILTELFDEQQNIVTVKNNGHPEKYFLFTKYDIEGEVNY